MDSHLDLITLACLAAKGLNVHLTEKPPPLSHTTKMRNRQYRNPEQPRKPSHWTIMWRRHPERLRQHIDRLSKMRSDKAEERGRLIQALFNMMPSQPMRAFELRDRLAALWLETYSEEIDKKQAWSEIRRAMRLGMVGRSDDDLYIPRHE